MNRKIFGYYLHSTFLQHYDNLFLYLLNHIFGIGTGNQVHSILSKFGRRRGFPVEAICFADTILWLSHALNIYIYTYI